MARDLSLIIACYDEAPHLAANVAEVTRELDACGYDYEIVFVDDASRDETRLVIAALCAEDDRRRCVFHRENRGRGAAIKTGFALSTGRVAGFLDIDLEIGARCLKPVIDAVLSGDCDVASGLRRYAWRDLGTATGALRFALSVAYRELQRMALPTGLRDTETGCKFFSRARAAHVVAGSVANDWFWDTEVMARAVLVGLVVREIPVPFRRRPEKRSTVRLLPDSIRQGRALFDFRRRVGLALSSKSPIYWTRAGFDSVMRALYGREYRETYARVARKIREDAQVVDVCCGTARLYSAFLRDRPVRYLGLDFNGGFVLGARRNGIDVRFFDLRRDAVPVADYVVLGSSLYHFRSHEDEVVSKLQRAARRAVIVTEPVTNVAASRHRYVRALAAWLSRAGVGDASARYDLESLRRLASRCEALEFEHRAGERNAVFVLPGRHAPDTAP